MVSASGASPNTHGVTSVIGSPSAPWKAKYPLGDQVALYLRCAGGNRVLQRPEVVHHRTARRQVTVVAHADRRTADDFDEKFGHLLRQLAVTEFDRRAVRRRRASSLGLGDTHL